MNMAVFTLRNTTACIFATRVFVNKLSVGSLRMLGITKSKALELSYSM